MCGIIGYSGAEYAREKLLHGLENLEYRGYDSAGIALWDEGKIEVIKAAGRLSNLRAACGDQCLASHCGIGHTRWATHGVPNDVNAHPHRQGRVTLVHNGIIENYRALRERLEREGYHFLTQTDTEIAAALLDHHMKLHESPVAAIHAATAEMEGAYGFCMLLEGEPDTVYGIRRGSPLIAAKDETGSYVASDVPAIIEYTRQYYLLEEEEVVVAHYGELRFYAPDGTPIEKEAKIANWSVEQAQKGGYPCFMQKEIHEQPRALADTIDGRTKDGFVTFEGDGLPDGFFRDVTKLYISACGTAMYSGMVGKAIIEKLARLPVEVEVASELRYRDPIFTPGCAAVVVSQSGETADTLAALRLFKENHIPVIGIVNVVGSSIAREADYCLYTYAGPEIAVASTKAYSVQVAMMYLLGFRIAADKGAPMDWCRRQLPKLLNAVSYLPHVLAMEPEFFRYAEGLKNAEHLFYLGRGLDYSLAMEGSLKLKEISYIHCEAYAAGELKHGTISLIEPGTLVVGVLTQQKLYEKTLSNLLECKTRGAYLMALTTYGNYSMEDNADFVLYIPKTDPHFAPSLAVIPLQLLGYYVSVAKGLDVDKPRNLAKSVTVE
mgnify:CR=1 FL=1